MKSGEWPTNFFIIIFSRLFIRFGYGNNRLFLLLFDTRLITALIETRLVHIAVLNIAITLHDDIMFSRFGCGRLT